MKLLKLKAICTRLLYMAALAICLACASHTALAQTDPDYPASTPQQTAEIALRLSSRDPLERQRAAEELARLTATDQQKMVEGYRLQERNSRVRLALDWALYRMGKRAALFNIVRDLDSSRRNQAHAYLTQLDSPEPLYIFFGHVDASTKARLLEVLAAIGDAETVTRISPYQASMDKKVAEAAKFAVREINLRLERPQMETPSRPRQVGKGSQEP